MADILSQEEIEALLSATEDNYEDEEEPLSEYVEISPGILRLRELAEMEEKQIKMGRSTGIPDIPDDENVIEGIKSWLCDLHKRMDKVEEEVRGLDEGLVEVEEELGMDRPEYDDDESSQEQVDRMMEMEMLKAMEEEGGDSSDLMDKLTHKKAPVENTEEIEIELLEDVFMKLAYLAHERDVTLNQLVNDLLRDSFEEE